MSNATPRGRSPHRFQAAIAVALAIVLGAPMPSEAGKKKGDKLVFQGLVTDRRGEPLEGVRVVFEAAKRKRSLGTMKKKPYGLVRKSELSAADGSFSFEWEWLGYYNAFRLRAVEGTGSVRADESYETLETVDVTDEVKKSNSISANLIVEDSEFVYEHRAFMEEWRSEDMRRVYADFGKPDRVDRHHGADGDEATWWFFERGKVYRFDAGALTTVEDFVPVEPF